MARSIHAEGRVTAEAALSRATQLAPALLRWRFGLLQRNAPVQVFHLLRGRDVSEERAANAVDRRLGQRVRTRRLELSMSQERLAELIGVTFQQVQKYEKGINRIAASRLFDIAAALDMSVARFFDGIGAVKEKSVANHGENVIQDVLATPEGMQLVTLFASIKSQKFRRRVVDVVRSLASE